MGSNICFWSQGIVMPPRVAPQQVVVIPIPNVKLSPEDKQVRLFHFSAFPTYWFFPYSICCQLTWLLQRQCQVLAMFITTKVGYDMYLLTLPMRHACQSLRAFAPTSPRAGCCCAHTLRPLNVCSSHAQLCMVCLFNNAVLHTCIPLCSGITSRVTASWQFSSEWNVVHTCMDVYKKLFPRHIPPFSLN